MIAVMPRPRLFLIDTFGFIFRAYHARARSGAPPMRTTTGISTEAVYIFNNMLRKLSKQYDPPYIAAVFESGAPTHRVQEFAEYKANRSETPPDLLDQIPFVRRVLEAIGGLADHESLRAEKGLVDEVDAPGQRFLRRLGRGRARLCRGAGGRARRAARPRHGNLCRRGAGRADAGGGGARGPCRRVRGRRPGEGAARGVKQRATRP